MDIKWMSENVGIYLGARAQLSCSGVYSPWQDLLVVDMLPLEAVPLQIRGFVET